MSDKTEKIDVSYVAHLARMHLTEEECSRFQEQMESIVGYVDKISELDLSDIEPTSHTMPVNNVLRADVRKESIDHDAVMENAPNNVDEQFAVPKIIE
jgi:aspartyl-tRNA(Asn)/glutamyl-tRNA(Gln) amidotransferase subunit C